MQDPMKSAAYDLKVAGYELLEAGRRMIDEANWALEDDSIEQRDAYARCMVAQARNDIRDAAGDAAAALEWPDR